MELFLFRHSLYEQRYNCSLIQIDSIPVDQRIFPIQSTVNIILGTVYYVRTTTVVLSGTGPFEKIGTGISRYQDIPCTGTGFLDYVLVPLYTDGIGIGGTGFRYRYWRKWYRYQENTSSTQGGYRYRNLYRSTL
jgi:hypothetical protein